MIVEVCPHMLDFSGLYDEPYYNHWVLDVSPVLKKTILELVVICTNCQMAVAAPQYEHNFWVMRTQDILSPNG